MTVHFEIEDPMDLTVCERFEASSVEEAKKHFHMDFDSDKHLLALRDVDNNSVVDLNY